MNSKINILGIRTVNELKTYWSNTDFQNLLNLMEYADANSAPVEELEDLVLMSLTDFEPDEAAQILLSYKLKDRLSAGQIQSLSHEMMEDKIAEEYADPAFHYDFFNINQLLYKAFDGTFPNTEASIISLQVTPGASHAVKMNEEILLKILSGSLSDRSIIHRLYGDQINGKSPLGDAAKIIWQFRKESEHVYEVLTSKYWVEKEDLEQMEYEVHME